MASLIVTSLLWAFSFGLIRHHLGHVDPRFVALSRLTLAALVFLPWLRMRGLPLRFILSLCLLGALQFGLMYLLYLFAFRTLQAYEVAVLTISTPIWVCLCDNLLGRTFPLRPLLAAALACVGTAVVLGANGFVQAPWQGILLMQASNACFALGQVIYRRMRASQSEHAERSLFGWIYVGACLSVLPFAVSTLPNAFTQLTLRESSVLIYLGIVASGIGFFLWNHGATEVRTSTLAVMNNAKTPLGIVVSLTCFGESVHLGRLLLGGATMLVAALYAQRQESA